MRNLGIEIKIIIGVIFFTLFIVGLERYQLSENIIDQFIESKKSKNELLINTISPIISLNMSLGLNDANKEYLELIIKQNSDLKYMELADKNHNPLFTYPKNMKIDPKSNINNMDNCARPIIDDITKKVIGYIYLEFYNKDYDLVVSKNESTTLKIFVVTFLLLSIYILLIKKEFKSLRELSNSVSEYDPKTNNFSLKKSNRQDEVGVIHNAIIGMVSKISSYAKMLDELNLSLEEKIKQRTIELEDANKKLEKLSTIDPLTKISNRRHFDTHIQNIWDLTTRSGISTAVIMCDIDNFKNINDTYGHIIGDEVLKNVAETIKNSLKRSTDLVARYGGEEFIIVMYNTDIEGAINLCEDIADKLKESSNFEIDGITIEPFTISFGVSCMVPNKEHKYELLIRASDKALYTAKENGKNCIVTKEP